MSASMDDAISQAWSDMDSAISGIVAELQTVEAQLGVATGNPSSADNSALLAEIQQRTTAIRTATQAFQDALSGAAAGSPSAPAQTVGTGNDTDVPTVPAQPVSTDPSTPVDTTQVGGVAASGGPDVPDGSPDNAAGSTVVPDQPADTESNQPTGGSPTG
jgi:hypothetical protein